MIREKLNPSSEASYRSEKITSELYPSPSFQKNFPSLAEVPFISEAELLLTRQVGSGSFGTVFHGILFSQDVAVKRLTVRNFTDELELYETDHQDEADRQAVEVARTLLALEKEVSIMKGLCFANIVQFYGICLNPAAIVTQYCSKGSLFELIGNARSVRRVARELTWKRRLKLAMDAAIGMNFLHSRIQPVLHRDLKSPNLLVDEHFQCKVADFNTSCFVDKTILTDTIQANNPRWMAPEIAEGKPHTKASDVYPFGIILWELMTWNEPFESETETLRPIQIITRTTRDGFRPEIIPNDKLMGGECPVYDDYITLMKECWHQDPDHRPCYKQVVDRLKMLMTDLSQQPEEKPIIIKELSRVDTDEPRATSPEPQPSQRSQRSSPFSAPPTRVSVDSRAGTCSLQIDGHAAVSQEVFEKSPFQNGPAPSEPSTNLDEDQVGQLYGQPLSLSHWSTQYSREDAIKTPEGREGRGKELWHRLSTEYFHIDKERSGSTEGENSNAMALWDSVRTMIFGERESDRFVENFSKFVLGDETQLRHKVSSFDALKAPVALKVIKAMMELKEKEEQKEKERDPWGIVKHLMLDNLKPSVRHPVWRALASSMNAHQTKETLEPILRPNEVSTEKTSKGKELWARLRDHLDLTDYQPSKPLKSPYWLALRQLFFDNDEEKESVVKSERLPESEETERLETETSSSSDALNPTKSRALVNWKHVQQVLGINPASFWDQYQGFLKNFATSQFPNEQQVGRGGGSKSDESSSVSSRRPKKGWARVRKLMIVDKEPPSEEKWHFVRGCLLKENLGQEWKELAAFIEPITTSPKRSEWYHFRKLFFENRNLREQSQWSFLKDLFLKQED